MAKFMIKALAVAALVCLVVDLAAASEVLQKQEAVGYGATDEIKDTTSTVAPSSFKDKVKGFYSSVKEGASGAFESVSDSVSEAAHKLEEKRKEAVAGTKKLVNGAIDKIKNSYDSYKNGDSEEEVPRVPESAEEHAKHAIDSVKSAVKTEKL